VPETSVRSPDYFWIRRSRRRSEPQKFAEGAFYFRFEFWIRNFAGGKNLHLARLQAEVAGLYVGIKLVAGGDNATVVIQNDFSGFSSAKDGICPDGTHFYTASPAQTPHPNPADALHGCCPPT